MTALLRRTLDERFAYLVGASSTSRNVVTRRDLPATKAQIQRSVERARQRREALYQQGLCLCTAPVVVRDGKKLHQCADCLRDNAANQKRKAGPRTCGCAAYGPHGPLCRDKVRDAA